MCTLKLSLDSHKRSKDQLARLHTVVKPFAQLLGSVLKFASVYYPPTCFEATCGRHPSCTAINVHATSGCDVPRGRRSCGDMVIGLIGHYRPSNGVFMAVSKMQENWKPIWFLTPSKNRRSPGSSLPATGAHTKQILTNVQRTELDCLGEIPGDFLGVQR